MSSLIAEPRLRPVTASPLTLIDLTDVPRVGFRGRDAAAWLTGLGLRLPEQPNKAVAQDDGTLVARLSQTEYLWLANLGNGSRIAKEEADWQQSMRANYLLPRQDSHAWFGLSGEQVSDVLAKLCGVDLRVSAFAPGNVAQTSVARLGCIVINASYHGEPCFYLLFDRPSLSYFRGALEDAMGEFQPALHL